MPVQFPALDDSFPRVVPSFRKLVKIMSECAAGGVSLNCAAYEYRQCDQALGTLLGNFMEVVRLKELPPEQVDSVNEILTLFAKISICMSSLESALGSDNAKLSATLINKVYDALKELEELNMDLKAAVGDRHLYSEVPVVDSLLRAGNFALETNEWDALGARLQSLIPDWNEIVAGEGLPEEFALHDQALDKLVNVVNNQDLKALPEVLQEVKETGEALTGFDDSQVVEDTASQVLCPFCGKPMMHGNSKCFACGARIPEAFEAANDQTKNGGKGGSVLPGDMPDYIQRLFEVAQDLPDNPKMFRPFRRAVGELRRRVAGSASKMEKIAASKVKMTPEVRENIDGVCDLAGSGLEKFVKALELLEGFEPPVDRFHLQCALEVVADAVEEMRGVGGLAQKYRNS